MIEHKNTILAIVLSLIVVVGWQYFIAKPQMERQQREAQLKQQEQAQLQQPGAAGRRSGHARKPGAPLPPGASGHRRSAAAPSRDSGCRGSAAHSRSTRRRLAAASI